MDTHDKGQIAELIIQKRAIERGFLISKPINHESRYDLIIDDGKKLLRTQIKYSNHDASHCEGAISIPLRKSHKNHALKYLDTEIDIVLVYIPKIDNIICLLPHHFHNKSSFQIRLELPKNGQVKKVNFYKDFLW